jgi:hypothetical protein
MAEWIQAGMIAQGGNALRCIEYLASIKPSPKGKYETPPTSKQEVAAFYLAWCLYLI